MVYTKYSHLEDDEFLRLIESKLGQSPILDELACRLNASYDQDCGCSIEDFLAPDNVMSCPVCEATL